MKGARAALIGLLLGLGLLGTPALALTVAERAAIAAAFDARLMQRAVRMAPTLGVSADALRASFAAAFTAWHKDNYPTAPDAARDAAFLSNMTSRLGALTPRDIADLRAAVAGGQEQAVLTRVFDAVAFYTIARSTDDPGTLTARRAWTRNPAGAYRTVRSAPPMSRADWGRIQTIALRNLDAVRQNRAMLDDSYGMLARNPVLVPPDKRRSFLADSHDRVSMTAGFAAELRARYAREGTAVDPALLKDLAEAKYVLTGWQRNALGTPQLVGAMRLEALEARLADGHPLARHLREAERTAGFRAEVVHPVGFVPPPDFAALLQGGYSLFDVGAGPYHGDDSHSIQLFALMQDQAENPGRWSYPVIDLVRAIGALDRPARPADRFGFEDAPSAWGAIFDLGNVNAVVPELSHPDSTQDVVRAHGALPRLATQLERKTIARAEMRSRLLAIAVADVQAGLNVRTRFPWIDQGGSKPAEVDAWIDAAAAAGATNQTQDIAGDIIYNALYFSRLQAQAPGLQRIDLGAGPIPALVEGGALPLDDSDPTFAVGLAVARSALDQARIRAQLPPAAASSSSSAAPDIDDALSDRAAAVSDGFATDVDIAGFEEDGFGLSDAQIEEGFGHAPLVSDAGSADPLRDSLADDDDDDASASTDNRTVIVSADADDLTSGYDLGPLVAEGAAAPAPPVTIETELDAVVLANLDALRVPQHNPSPDIAADLAAAEAHSEAAPLRIEDAPDSPREAPGEARPPGRAESPRRELDMSAAMNGE